MTLVAGLGNPGAEYVRTPHNVGFEVVEAVADRLRGMWRPSARFSARMASVEHAGRRLLLLEPQTYMNLSGSSVVPALRYHGGTADNLVVVLDDADLPPGRLRIRPSGGSGGHRGLASVIEMLGTDGFARIRVGVGRGRGEGLVGHVLGRMDPGRGELVAAAVAMAADAVLCLAAQGVAEAMNRFNGWDATDAAQPPKS